MGVYIKSMEMPETCRDCRLSTVIAFDKRPLCDALVQYMSYGEWEAKRLDNCPLVHVPPHGRLIDADALAGCLATLLQFPSNLVNGQWIVNTIREQSTIIPAEEDET